MKDVSMLGLNEQRMLGEKFALRRWMLYELNGRGAGDGARSI